MGTYRDEVGWRLLRALRSLPETIPMDDGAIRPRVLIEKILLGLLFLTNRDGWLNGSKNTPYSTRTMATELGEGRNIVEATIRLAQSLNWMEQDVAHGYKQAASRRWRSPEPISPDKRTEWASEVRARLTERRTKRKPGLSDAHVTERPTYSMPGPSDEAIDRAAQQIDGAAQDIDGAATAIDGPGHEFIRRPQLTYSRYSRTPKFTEVALNESDQQPRRDDLATLGDPEDVPSSSGPPLVPPPLHQETDGQTDGDGRGLAASRAAASGETWPDVLEGFKEHGDGSLWPVFSRGTPSYEGSKFVLTFADASAYEEARRCDFALWLHVAPWLGDDIRVAVGLREPLPPPVITRRSVGARFSLTEAVA